MKRLVSLRQLAFYVGDDLRAPKPCIFLKDRIADLKFSTLGNLSEATVQAETRSDISRNRPGSLEIRSERRQKTKFKKENAQRRLLLASDWFKVSKVAPRRDDQVIKKPNLRESCVSLNLPFLPFLQEP